MTSSSAAALNAATIEADPGCPSPTQVPNPIDQQRAHEWEARLHPDGEKGSPDQHFSSQFDTKIPLSGLPKEPEAEHRWCALHEQKQLRRESRGTHDLSASAMRQPNPLQEELRRLFVPPRA